ncbi:Fe-S protein assembly co-chaperone HscB [Denitratisoma sp. DHT3]|uniref:Fe-S protein assembly co-chaperone HscB n=1 Tax=Denitratisoma sp. DHT3 TaxID=1981880 RepID=UPI0011987CEC|nr:Fe-S protein assembly co-chaperone HscB [Denitratisoma sp. DHT3]QDX79856.1 Fe-S protein assembly co-chaperone HscB [Denitratisoma sp. DHT3]
MTSEDLQLTADHFSLFGLPRVFGLDLAELDRRYLEVQHRVHPDKHAHLTEADRRVAMQWATRANEAYQTLKSPLQRAHYLLLLAGHDPQVERNTAMAPEFLVSQMEWRESVEEAREDGDVEGLEQLHARLRGEMKAQYAALGQALDAKRNYADAGVRVRQLMFQEKLLHEIDEALEASGA